MCQEFLNHAVRNGSDGVLIATIQGNNDRIVPTDTELYVAQEVGKACALFRLKLLDWLIIWEKEILFFQRGTKNFNNLIIFVKILLYFGKWVQKKVGEYVIIVVALT